MEILCDMNTSTTVPKTTALPNQVSSFANYTAGPHCHLGPGPAGWLAPDWALRPLALVCPLSLVAPLLWLYAAPALSRAGVPALPPGCVHPTTASLLFISHLRWPPITALLSFRIQWLISGPFSFLKYCLCDFSGHPPAALTRPIDPWLDGVCQLLRPSCYDWAPSTEELVTAVVSGFSSLKVSLSTTEEIYFFHAYPTLNI